MYCMGVKLISPISDISFANISLFRPKNFMSFFCSSWRFAQFKFIPNFSSIVSQFDDCLFVPMKG